MRDFVYVQEGQEEAFVERALLLGYDELVFVYEKQPKKPFLTEKIKICPLIKNKKTNEGYFVLGTSLTTLPKSTTHLVANEFETEKDFVHQRRSGLNHVVLKSCQEKNVVVLFAFAPLQSMNSLEQSTILGRMKQNALLCKKYKVPLALTSLATTPQEMRHAKDVQALSRSLLSLTPIEWC